MKRPARLRDCLRYDLYQYILFHAESKSPKLSGVSFFPLLQTGLAQCGNFVFIFLRHIPASLADSSFQTTGTISKAPWDIQVTGVPDELTYGDTFTLHSESGVNWSASGGATVDSAGNVTVTGAGEVTITATKPGDENHEDTEYPIYLYSGRKALTISGAVGGKAYDGTNEAEITGVTLEGIMGDDDVSVNTVGLTGTLNGSDVGTYTAVTLPRLTLTGGAASNYILSQLPGAVPASVTIRKAAPLTPKTGDLADALLLGGKLDNHLADTNQQAEDMFSQLVKQMAAKEGIPLGPAHCQLIADVQRLLRVQLPRGERLADLIAQHVGVPFLLPARDCFIPGLAQKKFAAGGEGVALVGADQGPVQGLFRVLTVVEAVRQGGQNRLVPADMVGYETGRRQGQHPLSKSVLPPSGHGVQKRGQPGSGLGHSHRSQGYHLGQLLQQLGERPP